MPEEVEVETKDLQETIGEIHERHEKGEHEKGEKEKLAEWVRYIALSTAIFAVFAAVGAMQSGAYVNEAMMQQIKASDTWSEFQANKQKEYLFTLQAETLLDRGVLPPATSGADTPPKAALKSGAQADKSQSWKALSPSDRLAELTASADNEHGKTDALKSQAEKYEKESEERIERHHRFAWSVALIQVAIALSAIAALTKIRLVWVVSLVIGLIGIFFFVQGMVP